MKFYLYLTPKIISIFMYLPIQLCNLVHYLVPSPYCCRCQGVHLIISLLFNRELLPGKLIYRKSVSTSSAVNIQKKRERESGYVFLQTEREKGRGRKRGWWRDRERKRERWRGREREKKMVTHFCGHISFLFHLWIKPLLVLYQFISGCGLSWLSTSAISLCLCSTIHSHKFSKWSCAVTIFDFCCSLTLYYSSFSSHPFVHNSLSSLVTGFRFSCFQYVIRVL